MKNLINYLANNLKNNRYFLIDSILFLIIIILTIISTAIQAYDNPTNIADNHSTLPAIQNQLTTPTNTNTNNLPPIRTNNNKTTSPTPTNNGGNSDNQDSQSTSDQNTSSTNSSNSTSPTSTPKLSTTPTSIIVSTTTNPPTITQITYPTSSSTPTSVPTSVPTSTPIPTNTSVPTPANLPDLIITGVHIYEPPMKVATWNYLMVDIKNQGNAKNLGMSNIKANITDSLGRNTVCQVGLENLEPNQSYTTSLHCIVYSPNTANAEIKIDANNAIPETNEANNTFSYSFNVEQ